MSCQTPIVDSVNYAVNVLAALLDAIQTVIPLNPLAPQSLYDTLFRLPLLGLLRRGVHMIGHKHSLARQFYGRQTPRQTAVFGVFLVGGQNTDRWAKNGRLTSYFAVLFVPIFGAYWY